MKNKNSKYLTNKKMNNEVYKLRREVMNFIYEAKNLLRDNGVSMPRIDVRITENDPEVLGVGRLKDNIIWITQAGVDCDYDLRALVFHELVHAVTGFGHDSKCYLMCPSMKPGAMSKAKIHKAFLSYF